MAIVCHIFVGLLFTATCCNVPSDVLNIEFVLNSVNAHPVELLSRFWVIIDVLHDAILLLVIVI